MKRSHFLWGLLFALVVVCFHTSASADVVYDSLSTSTTSWIAIKEIGNTVTLSGSKRFVTSFSINAAVSSSNIGQENDYILRFYLPTAPDGYPGKLFWQSPPKTDVVMTGGTQTITFDVPYVRVLHTFIWSYTKDPSLSSGSDCGLDRLHQCRLKIAANIAFGPVRSVGMDTLKTRL